MFDIEQEIREALRRYGSQGDKTYECIAFTVVNRDVSDCKTYRFCKTDTLDAIEDTLHIPHSYIADLKECSDTNLELFEASVRESNEEQYARFVLKMKTNIAAEARNHSLKRFTDCFDRFQAYPIIMKAAEILESTISPRRGTITQMGVEIGQSGDVAALKSYFSLRPYGYAVQKFGQFPTLEHIEEVLRVLWREFGLSDTQDALLRAYSAVLLNYHYYPFLLGLTHRADSTECKIYYVLHPRKAFEDVIVTHEKNVLRELDCLHLFGDNAREALHNIDELQQCLRGMSIVFSKETQSKLNLFFGPK